MYPFKKEGGPSRRFGFFLFLIGFHLLPLHAQQRANPVQLLRLYEDNDAVNFLRKPTDEAYSNGTRVDYFYTRKRSPAILSIFKRDSGSVNTGGISVMHVMITPKDYSKTYLQPHDYRYSGALFVSKSLFSSNPDKKCNLETEIVIGIIGPYSFAGQFQSFIHGMIGNDKPMGWNTQYPTDLLLNLNITGEKQLVAKGKWLEVILGQNISLGTMLDAASVYSTFRFGRMNPYFNGYVGQYTSSGVSKNSQIYFIARPNAEFIVRNALLQGGMIFTSKQLPKEERTEELNDVSPEMLTASMDLGMVAVFGNFSLSLIQKTMTSVLRGLPSHSVGNISLTYGW